MNSHRILGHNPAYRALWAARTVSITGDAVATVALVFYASGRATPGPSVGLLLLAQSAPYLLGPFAGALADRVDQRRLLLACELGQAALFGAIALLLPPFPLLLALVLAATALAALALPAGRSAVPILAGPGEATAAYALLGSGGSLGRALGPALGGLLLAAVGPRGALALDVASFVAAAALLRGLPALPPAPRAHDAPTDFLGAARVGWSYLLGQPTARAVAASLVLLVSFGALGNVALVFLARDALAMGARGFGTLAAASAIGMVVGPLLALRPDTRPAPVLVGGIALMGAGALLTGVAPVYAVALAAQGLFGVGNGLENWANDTLVQRAVPQALLGRVFGGIYSGAYVASVAAYAAGGLLLTALPPRAIFIISGGGLLLAALIAHALLRRAAGGRGTGAAGVSPVAADGRGGGVDADEEVVAGLVIVGGDGAAPPGHEEAVRGQMPRPAVVGEGGPVAPGAEPLRDERTDEGGAADDRNRHCPPPPRHPRG